jgi:O-succinylbenzoate synthase
MGRPTRVELRRISLLLVSPFVAAHGAEHVRDLVLVRVELDDGTGGWGECSALTHPTYTGEYTAGAWAALRNELVPRFFAGRPWGVVGHPMASAALLTAEADADLRRIDRRLADQLGLMHRCEPRREVVSRAVVGRGETVDQVVAQVASRIEEGHRAVKLKIAPRRLDLDALMAVRATWPDMDLAADANGSLSAGDRDVLGRIDALGLSYLEQPVHHDDLDGAADLAKRLGTPIALDESITSEAAARTAIRFGAAAILNVKPARVGGPVEASRIVQTATDLGIPAFVGGMLETGIGRAAALAVAALPGCVLPSDLGPSGQYFATDLTEPFLLSPDGTLSVPTGAGIGVEPDQARLDAATVDRLVFEFPGTSA